MWLVLVVDCTYQQGLLAESCLEVKVSIYSVEHSITFPDRKWYHLFFFGRLQGDKEKTIAGQTLVNGQTRGIIMVCLLHNRHQAFKTFNSFLEQLHFYFFNFLWFICLHFLVWSFIFFYMIRLQGYKREGQHHHCPGGACAPLWTRTQFLSRACSVLILVKF